MSSMSKREKERYYFELFRTHYPLPDGIVEYGDKPDVILQGKRRIGIEITNFFLEEGSLLQSEQVQKRARDEVVSKAQRIYQARNNRRFRLIFGFAKSIPIRDRKELANKIADLATRVEAMEDGLIRRDVFQDIPELSFAYLLANENYVPRWRVSQLHSTPIMSLALLKEIIEAKEEKSKYYRRCDAYWLLVVVDFVDPAQDQEIQIQGFDTVGSEVFEKVLVYKTYFGHVLEINRTTAQ